MANERRAALHPRCSLLANHSGLGAQAYIAQLTGRISWNRDPAQATRLGTLRWSAEEGVCGCGHSSLEHGDLAYRRDLAIFGSASAGLAAVLVMVAPRVKLTDIIVCAALGLAGWSIVECGLDRFVLHGFRPFSSWHAEHHRRPTARIYSPTIASVTLIATLVYIPAWIMFGPWPASAVTFGIVTGDFCYAITHHAVHHWAAEVGWIHGRKRWHGLHHARRHDLPGGAAISVSRPHFGITYCALRRLRANASQGRLALRRRRAIDGTTTRNRSRDPQRGSGCEFDRPCESPR